MRLSWVVFAALTVAAWGGANAPYEVVRDHIAIEVLPDGNYAEAREVRYRVLNAEGIARLHQQTLSFVQGYETLHLNKAYTQKADGKRLDVSGNGIMNGVGMSSQHGVSDRLQMNVFFPNVEIGDTIVLATVRRQLRPIIPGSFSFVSYQPVNVAVHDVLYDVTVPESYPLHIDASGLTSVKTQHAGGKVRRVWSCRRDKAAVRESDAVAEIDVAPHLILSNYEGYGQVAVAYREASHEQAQPTPEISALARKLTDGVTDRRERARILYEWVTRNIAYAAIVLGNGSFTPHAAGAVLSARYGDCKDHVVLLEALLSAVHIRSSAVVVHVATPSYRLPKAAAVFYFDHVITYLPDFDLYLDSTNPLAPFGVLPSTLAGKPALRVDTGKIVFLPLATSANSTLRLKSRIVLNEDGSVASHTVAQSTGAIGLELRASMRVLAPGKDISLLEGMLGPGASGSIDRGAPASLRDPYTITADASVPDVIPGQSMMALPFYLAYKPVSFTRSLAGSLPVTRTDDYLCPGVFIEDDQTIVLPQSETVVAMPASGTMRTRGIEMRFDYARKTPRTFGQKISLRIDHPGPTCSPAYYASVRADVAEMVRALRGQIILQRRVATAAAGHAGQTKGQKK